MNEKHLLTKRLFHIESEGYNNFEVGDCLHIDGKALTNYGKKIFFLIEQEGALTSDEKEFTKHFLKQEDCNGCAEIDSIINKLKNLTIKDRQHLRKSEILLGEILFELHRKGRYNLPSRMKSIFLTEMKYVEPWLNTLPSSIIKKEDKSIYEFKIIDIYRFHQGDENLKNQYNSLDYFTQMYWEGKTLKLMEKLEIKFQGNLEVINVYPNINEFKTYNFRY